MKNTVIRSGLILIIILSSTVLFAQNYYMNGRSAIGFNMGFYTGSTAANTATINGLNTEVSANGFAGSLFFSHWMRENLALKLSAGLLTGSANVKVNASSVSQQASAVFPVLLGLNYYIPEPLPSEGIRPFIGLAAGVYIGSEANNTMIAQQVHSEAAFGGRANAGVDFIVGSSFILGASIGYNLMSDFSTPVGGKKNYNGADFSLQLSYVF